MIVLLASTEIVLRSVAEETGLVKAKVMEDVLSINPAPVKRTTAGKMDYDSEVISDKIPLRGSQPVIPSLLKKRIQGKLSQYFKIHLSQFSPVITLLINLSWF